MMNHILYPGTFDPVTLGHVDLIERALKLFPQVTIAIAENARKQPALPLDKRVELAEQIFEREPRVHVTSFRGLLVHLAQNMGINVILRGLRAVSDFEMEFQLAAMNRQLDANVETLFLMPAVEYQCISSSMVRDVATMGGDLEQFVPKVVAESLRMHYRHAQ
jgi:pantetheine-phosphate adenylyltransferase